MAIDPDRGDDSAGSDERRSPAIERPRRKDPAQGWRFARVAPGAGARSGRRQQGHSCSSGTDGGSPTMTTILIVEDNEMNRDMLSRRLERKGYRVLLAVDGAEGVDVARVQMPDLILMDMSLPVVDGWEATRRIKADEKLKHIPIIALTAHAMANDREKALDAGCDDYDTKPIELPRLLARIEALLLPPQLEHVS